MYKQLKKFEVVKFRSTSHFDVLYQYCIIQYVFKVKLKIFGEMCQLKYLAHIYFILIMGNIKQSLPKHCLTESHFTTTNILHMSYIIKLKSHIPDNLSQNERWVL